MYLKDVFAPVQSILSQKQQIEEHFYDRENDSDSGSEDEPKCMYKATGELRCVEGFTQRPTTEQVQACNAARHRMVHHMHVIRNTDRRNLHTLIKTSNIPESDRNTFFNNSARGLSFANYVAACTSDIPNAKSAFQRRCASRGGMFCDVLDMSEISKNKNRCNGIKTVYNRFASLCPHDSFISQVAKQKKNLGKDL